MLAADLAMALAPALLAKAAGSDLDDWQRNLLRSTSPRALINVSRQGGKSTATAILAMHTALCQPGSLVLLISPSLHQSAELFRACLRIYQAARGTARRDAAQAGAGHRQ